jgi:hypothetical protein
VGAATLTMRRYRHHFPTHDTERNQDEWLFPHHPESLLLWPMDIDGKILSIGEGAVALFVGIRCGAISSDMKLSSQAARSIG